MDIYPGAENWTLSYSGIKALLKSVDHFILYKTKPSEKSDSMRIGSAFDRFLLEGVAPIIMPAELSRTTKEGKAKFAELTEQAEKEGKQVVSFSEMVDLSAMLVSVMAHPVAGSMIKAEGKPQNEFTLRYSPDLDGQFVTLHGKMDKHIPASGKKPEFIVELKTCASADIQDIERAIVNFGYYIQAMMYRFPSIATGKFAEYRMIFVETKAPFGVQVIALDEGWYEKAMADIDLAARRLIAYQSGKLNWTGYSDKTITISMPNYLAYKPRNAGATAPAQAPKPSTACPPSSREETTADAPAPLPPEKQAEPASPHLAPANVGASASSTAPTPEEPRKRRERSDKGKPRGPRIAPPASDTAEPKPSTPEPEAPAAEAKQDTIPKDPRVGKAILDKSSHIRVAVWDNLLERGSKRWQTEQIFKCEIGVSECLIQKPFMDWTQSEIEWFATSHGI